MTEQKDYFIHDVQDDNKLPSGINVLTILTFIGSGIAFLGGLYTYFTAEKSYEMVKSGQFKDLPSSAKKFMPANFEEIAMKGYENRLPIMVLGIVGAVLCIYGAMEMRKRKKQGFYVYVVGALLPLLSSALFMGVGATFGGFGLIGVAITALFIGLYAAQQKHLS
jgi:hypothetical protein